MCVILQHIYQSNQFSKLISSNILVIKTYQRMDSIPCCECDASTTRGRAPAHEMCLFQKKTTTFYVSSAGSNYFLGNWGV